MIKTCTYDRQGAYVLYGFIATNIPVDIPLNSKEMQLAPSDKGPLYERVMGHDERYMCICRGEMNIIGDIDIDFIVIDGVEKVFH